MSQPYARKLHIRLAQQYIFPYVQASLYILNERYSFFHMAEFLKRASTGALSFLLSPDKRKSFQARSMAKGRIEVAYVLLMVLVFTRDLL